MNEQQAGHNTGPANASRSEGSLQAEAQNLYQGGSAYAGSFVGGGYRNQPDANMFNALTLMRIIMHRWVSVLLMGVLGALCGVLYLVKATPVYRAQAELEMSVRRPKVINNDAVFEDPTASRDTDVIFNTRFAKFRSPAMEALVAKEYLQRYEDQTETSSGIPINRTTLSYWIREAEWNKDPSANIVYVSFEASDPRFAAQLVNTLSECAGLLMAQENRAQSDEAVKWLVSQAQDQRLVLEEEERDLATLREELQLDSIEQRKLALGQALVTVSKEKEALISDLSSRKTIYDFVSKLKETDPNLEMLPSGLPKERELNELIRVWRASNDTLLEVADRYTELHPEYRKAADIEARNRQRLEEFIDLSVKAVLNDIELLENQIKQIDARIADMKNEALDHELALATGLRKLERLERKRDAAADSYQAMLRRMEEARLSADENMAFTKTIRHAEVPRFPVSPRKAQSIILGTIFGLMAGSLMAIVVAFWTDKIGSVADLKALGLNILATIPSQKKVDSRSELATIGLRDKFSPIVEIFAGINAVISSGRYFEYTKVLLTCSIGPGEGKTISACNLAITSAFNGTRTLLIDGDLRRPQISNIFNIDEEHPSLIDWLANTGENLECDQLISCNVVENLDIISSRPNKEINPAELLGRNNLTELLVWARANYERVIIDSPPIGLVGDAQVLANLSDSGILVSRIGKTKKRPLKFALARFDETHMPLLGCVVNDVPHSLFGMFGGAEGYGYSYGYGSY